MQDQDPMDRYNFVISYELLELIEWLVENEQESLKKLIKNAVQSGVTAPKSRHVGELEEKSEELQQNIVELFALMDTLLHEVVHEDEAQDMLERSLVPAINHVDTRMYDSDSISASLSKATAAVGKKSGSSPKEILCKELLKRWKPAPKKSLMN